MAIASNFPAIRPSLNLDFANARALDPRITFSRASAATYYDGKTVAKAEENLLLQSQTFDGANWLKLNATVTADAGVAPDGTSTADKIAETAATGFHGPIQPLTGYVGQTVTFSVYLKAVERTWALVWFDADSAGAYYDLSTGALGTVSAGVTASPGVAVGNGWYRCAITRTITSGASPRVFTATGNNTVNYAGTDGSGILIWGAQLEQRSQVTAYTPTTTQPITNYIPVLQTAPTGVPRFDHNPVTGESLGLLIEEQRTNLLTYSEQFGNAAFTKAFASVQNNEVVAPDGTFTADKMIESVGVSTHFVSSITTLSAGGTYTLSVYAKAAGRNTLSLQFVNGSAGTNCFFDLASGTNTANNTFGGYGGSVGTPTITHVGNGWYRCSTTVTIDSTAVQSIRIGTTASNGDGYSGLYIWGAQIEAGTFPTSYIKTEASQVTRAADSAAMTGANFSSWYRQDEGTVFCESESAGYNATNITATSVAFHDGTINNRIRLAHAGNVRFNVAVNGVDSTGLTNAYKNGTMVKNAACYKVDNFAYASAGQVAQTDNSGVVPVVNQMGIGGWLTGRDNNGHIKRIAYYPKRLTDAQLQALTA